MEKSNTQTGVMEFFILALIGRMGLASLYAFRQDAGLEPGGIGPAIRRLESLKLITRGEPARRRRRELALTPTGREFLEGRWTGCIRHYGDGESVLRSAGVALIMEGPKRAADYLDEMGATRRSESTELKMRQEYLDRSQKDALSTLEWMRICTEAHRRDAESKAFLSISQSLRERSRNDVYKEVSSAGKG
ncbi:MAG TPA: hypothetical protein VMU48_05885 [Terracidiphilus sp.]|nr:hypothetical protein [Terracidiphilus sp.]